MCAVLRIAAEGIAHKKVSYLPDCHKLRYCVHD